MSKNIPAFPVQIRRTPSQIESYSGLTKRQWYAGMAMQGLLAAQIHGFNDTSARGPFVSMAFEIADAMLQHEENEDA